MILLKLKTAWKALRLSRSMHVIVVLLDVVMPRMDGFGVLDLMNKYHWIEDIPVIMISAERGSSHIEWAFELGITDFISRPFDALIVHRRVVNTILLYAKQKSWWAWWPTRSTRKSARIP